MLVYNDDLNICVGVGGNTIIKIEEATVLFDCRLTINGITVYSNRDKLKVKALMKSIINGYELGRRAFFV